MRARAASASGQLLQDREGFGVLALGREHAYLDVHRREVIGPELLQSSERRRRTVHIVSADQTLRLIGEVYWPVLLEFQQAIHQDVGSALIAARVEQPCQEELILRGCIAVPEQVIEECDRLLALRTARLSREDDRHGTNVFPAIIRVRGRIGRIAFECGEGGYDLLIVRALATPCHQHSPRPSCVPRRLLLLFDKLLEERLGGTELLARTRYSV